MTHHVKVVKKAGNSEKFSKAKFCASLRKAGAPIPLVNELYEKIANDIHPGITTSTIFRNASKYLIKKDPVIAARYNIKKGIAELGPAGFLFERYVEIIMQALGYKTRRNVIMKGVCATHEVDILAKNKTEHIIIEVKYHNERKIITHIDVVMYAGARKDDIEDNQKTKERNKTTHIMWLFTNTRFSSSAIKYAKCKNIRLTGWNYPKDASLEKIVNKYSLYPITVLPSVDRATREIFVRYNIMLAQDLSPYSAQDIHSTFGISIKKSEKIAREVNGLIHN